MFGAPPVGHVMDPQFKPVFLEVMEICMQMQVCSINPIGGLAKGNIPHMYARTYVQQWVYMYILVYMILCISMAGFRGIYQIFRHIFSIIQYAPLKCIQIANITWYYVYQWET